MNAALKAKLLNFIKKPTLASAQEIEAVLFDVDAPMENGDDPLIARFYAALDQLHTAPTAEEKPPRSSRRQAISLTPFQKVKPSKRKIADITIAPRSVNKPTSKKIKTQSTSSSSQSIDFSRYTTLKPEQLPLSELINIMNAVFHYAQSHLVGMDSLLMRNPVTLLATGETYEYDDIMAWLQENNTSPKTGEQIDNNELIPCYNSRELIQALGEPLAPIPELTSLAIPIYPKVSYRLFDILKTHAQNNVLCEESIADFSPEQHLELAQALLHFCRIAHRFIGSPDHTEELDSVPTETDMEIESSSTMLLSQHGFTYSKAAEFKYEGEVSSPTPFHKHY